MDNDGDQVTMTDVQISHLLWPDEVPTSLREWPDVFRVHFNETSEFNMPEVLRVAFDLATGKLDYQFAEYEILEELARLEIHWQAPEETSLSDVNVQNRRLTDAVANFAARDLATIIDEVDDDIALRPA